MMMDSVESSIFAAVNPGFLTPFWTGIATVAFLAASVLLILTVLIQRPQGGGLSGAFGAGAGSGQTAFGAKTGDALTWATVLMFVLWLLIAVGLVFAARPQTTPAGNPAAGTPGAATDTAPAEGDGTGESTEGPGANVIDLDDLAGDEDVDGAAGPEPITLEPQRVDNPLEAQGGDAGGETGDETGDETGPDSGDPVEPDPEAADDEKTDGTGG